eukprot:1011942-Pyramimonas_sp.AAC.1
MSCPRATIPPAGHALSQRQTCPTCLGGIQSLTTAWGATCPRWSECQTRSATPWRFYGGGSPRRC